jgi:hypothetical protein
MEVLTREQFASPHQEAHELPQGLTIDEMLTAVQWNPALRPWTQVVVEGQAIPPALWRSAKPRKGRRVLVVLRPAGGMMGGGGGGGGSKGLLMAVAAIAIVVVAAVVAPYIVGAIAGVSAATASATLGTAVALTQAGLAIAGTLALGALVRPSSIARQALANTGSGGNAASESSTYGVTGAQNSLTPYGVVPRVYGRHRVTPPLAAEPYIVSSGTSQTINMLLDFGYGPLLVEDIRIGNTDISEFPSARWHLHSEFKAGDPLYIYGNDQATASVGAVLAELVDNVRQVPQAASVITLEFQFPGGLVEFNDQGQSFQRNEHITVFANSEDGSTGWQPISNFYPYAHFQGEGGTQTSGAAQVGSIGVVLWSRGTFDGYPKGFLTTDPVANTMQIGTLFTYEGSSYTIVGRSTTPGGETAIELNGLPPNIAWIYTNTGIIPGEEGRAGTFPLPGSAGTFGPLTVTFGPSSYDVEFHGQTRSPRTVSVYMQMPYENKWQILVRRSTPVSGSALVSNQIIWGTIRAGRWVAPIAPKTPRTILELQVTATDQISGQVQNINALCTSILLDRRIGYRVPTRNPAWIYQDILVGKANPRPIPLSRTDKDKLIEWADKNDALTVQGDVFATCDLVVDFRSTIGELCQTVCSTGRAAPAVVDGLYSVMLEDENKVPVQMFTNRNSSGFSISRTWVDQPHALKIRYLSENTWDRQEFYVYADGYDALTATKFENLELMGITRPTQAWRFGRYFQAAAKLRRERLSLQSDIENLVCQRGDLVRIAHDRLLSNFTARVREIDGSLVTMDGYLQTDIVSDAFTVTEADSGAANVLPSGWQIVGAANAGVTVTPVAKGTDGRGRGYMELEITKAAAAGAANLIQILPDTMMGEINSDDNVVSSWEMEVLSLDNFVGDAVNVIVQPTNSTGGTGLGSVSQNFPFPLVGDLEFYQSVEKPGSTLGLVNGWRSSLEIRWDPTTDYPAVMRVRVFTPQFFVNNRKRDLLQRVDDVHARLIPNAEAAGAVVGGIGSGGQFPTGWTQPQFAGWTRTITRVAKVWSYYEFDIRMQANAGAAAMSIQFVTQQDLPPSKIIFARAQLRLISAVGTPPIARLRATPQTEAGGFIQNNNSPNITLSTTQEEEFAWGPINYSVNPATAEKFAMAFTFTPGNAAEATDATIRIRLPIVSEGSTSPTAGLPAEPEPAPLYGQLRAGNGGLLDSFPILAVPAEDQVLVGEPASKFARAEDLLSIGSLGTETSEWLVDKITPGPDFVANLDLIEYAPSVLDADKGAIPPYVPNNGSGILADLPPVRNLILSSTLYAYTAGGVPIHTNLLQWDPPTFKVAFYIISRLYVVPNPGEGNSTPPFDAENVLQEIARVVQRAEYVDTIDTRTLRDEGTLIRYYVTPVAASGRRGSAVSVEDTFFTDTTAPPAVNFTTNVMSETTMLIWDRPDIPDLGGYQVRFADRTTGMENPLWENMVSVVDSISPALTSLTVHIQTGTYAIRAFDTSGNFGPATYSVTKIDELPNVNEVTRLTEGPTWAGRFDRTEIVDGQLRLAKNTSGAYFSEGWYYPDSAVAYPASWVFRIRGAFRINSFPIGDDPRGDWNAQIWVSIQKAAPKLNSSWFSPLSHADPLAGGPGVYVPLGNVSQTDLVGRLINWAIRLTSKRPTLTAAVTTAWMIVDHSERREFGNDRATGTGGLNINFTRPFFEPPTVSVTLNDGDVGDRIVKSASTTALTVEVFNNAGVSVNRKIDWQAIGYGKGMS